MRWSRGKLAVVVSAIVVAVIVGAATMSWMNSGEQKKSERVLAGNVKFMKTNSNLPEGWANFTINLSKPSAGVMPGNVKILIYKLYWWEWDEIVPNYTDAKPEIGEWTYIDSNGDKRISSGETLVVHARDFKGIYTNYILSITYDGFKGYMNCSISMGKTHGSVKLVSDEHDLHSGWINFTISLHNPKHLKSEDVFVGIAQLVMCPIRPTPANYTEGTPKNGEWTYIDMDSSGDISSGDEIILRFTNLTLIEYGSQIQYQVKVSPYYYKGYLYKDLVLGILTGDFKLDASNSTLESGWLNLTLILQNPNELEVSYVHLFINRVENPLENITSLNYSDRISSDNQWDYTDLNGNGKLDSEDRITIYSMAIAKSEYYNAEIFYDFYDGSIPTY